jgi:hypothetical protein
MAKKGTQADEISAVEFTNQYNADVDGFQVELSMQVVDVPDGKEVIAGISIDMGDGGMPAFIPADILRHLADEAEADARRAIAQANSRRG